MKALRAPSSISANIAPSGDSPMGIAAAVLAAADANAPGMPIGVSPDGAIFAEIDDGALKAFIAQHVGYGVRDVALGNAVQRDGHAGACEPDCACAAFDPAEIHEAMCNVARAGQDVRLNFGMGPEMRLVKPP